MTFDWVLVSVVCAGPGFTTQSFKILDKDSRAESNWVFLCLSFSLSSSFLSTHPLQQGWSNYILTMTSTC